MDSSLKPRPSTTADLVRFVGWLMVFVSLCIVFLAAWGIQRAPKVEDPSVIVNAALDALGWVAIGISTLATGGVVARKAAPAAAGLRGLAQVARGKPTDRAAEADELRETEGM